MFDENEQILLNQMNKHLSQYSVNDFHLESDVPMPLLMVVGLPRSGTTLIMQILAAGLEVNYIDNFAARFWKAPVHGLVFSRISKIKSYKISFESDHGRTLSFADPHEFSYFWKEQLKYVPFQYYDSRILEKDINWYDLAETLNMISRVEKKPFLFKAIHLAKYLSHFQNYRNDFLVIELTRNEEDVAYSLLKAREKRSGDQSKWWSIMPNDFEDIKNLPYSNQIPLYIKMLKNDFNVGLEGVKKSHRIKIDYEQLCKAPHEIVRKVAKKIYQIFGIDCLSPSLEKVIPKEFIVSTRGFQNDPIFSFYENRK